MNTSKSILWKITFTVNCKPPSVTPIFGCKMPNALRVYNPLLVFHRNIEFLCIPAPNSSKLHLKMSQTLFLALVQGSTGNCWTMIVGEGRITLCSTPVFARACLFFYLFIHPEVFQKSIPVSPQIPRLCSRETGSWDVREELSTTAPRPIFVSSEPTPTPVLAVPAEVNGAHRNSSMACMTFKEIRQNII